MEAFARLDHLVIRPTVRVFGEVVDELLAQKGLSRHVRLVTPSYLSVPYAVASSRMVALVPRTLFKDFHDRFGLRLFNVDALFPDY